MVTMSAWKRKASSGGVDFELPPVGSHAAILVGIFDLGTQKDDYQGKTNANQKVFLVWEIPSEKRKDGRPCVIGKGYTFSLNKKAALRAMVEKWAGKTLAEDQEFDLSSLLGKKCLLAIGRTGDGDKYATHNGVSPLPKGMAVPDGAIKPAIWAIADGTPIPELPWVPFSYGESIREIIERSPEWGRLNSNAPSEGAGDGGSDDGSDAAPF